MGGAVREEAWEAGPGDDGMRLDMFLVGRLPDCSRAAVQRLIADGRVALDGRAARSHRRVRCGDRVAVAIPPPEAPTVAPEERPLEALHEDADLIVINKPAGMIVHPAGRVTAGTLVNALLGRRTGLSGVGGVLKPGIVHRLDKGTSGCILVAKNDRAHLGLSAQFARREVFKEYLAVVHGEPPAGGGTLEGLIGRHPGDRKRMAVLRDRGRRAVTRFEVLERFGTCALVRLELETGRTHQIRVQMAHLGFPVVGDPVYGRRRPRIVAGVEAARPMLHAARIGFAHPRTGRRLLVGAPLPADFERFLAALRGGGARAAGGCGA
ncbi:MAG: RluA family pseudouridine synthase [bacterium]|nr:RluA family pseudouridine synthase [bacterium]